MIDFEPTKAAALARLDEVQPDAYARTRNMLHGAVTRLSPYITHGLLSLREVYTSVHACHPFDSGHKFVFELGWRTYWRHVWQHLGDGIHESIHSGLLPDSSYQQAVPDDVLEARTGVPAIDQAVRDLYATGYLHNHARMWVASYLVHLRKVHWHTGAQWMLGHLLDGDVASNHLSWQWVAGTGSNKPYLFNAENVAKYAPAHWHSPGTVIDTSYEALGLLACSPSAVRSEIDSSQGTPLPVPPPKLLAVPPGDDWSAPEPSLVAGRDVWLVHPWSLGAELLSNESDAVCIGIGLPSCHARTPWSARRWNFVTEGIRARTSVMWWSDVQELVNALKGARKVAWQSEPHVSAALREVQERLLQQPVRPQIQVHEEACVFEPVQAYCPSFSKWWRDTRIATQTSTP